jgi:membrane-associated phospholipid phosphatase
MFIKINSVYDFISLFALLVNIYILYTLDPVLIFGSLTCLFFHDFIKELTRDWYPSIFKRPDGARNCSLFNNGGLVDHKPGFPSGHVTSISFLMNMLLLRNKDVSFKKIILYNVPILIMAYARIMKGCHNLIQVIAGYILGYSIAHLFHSYANEINHGINNLYSYFVAKK